MYLETKQAGDKINLNQRQWMTDAMLNFGISISVNTIKKTIQPKPATVKL